MFAKNLEQKWLHPGMYLGSDGRWTLDASAALDAVRTGTRHRVKSATGARTAPRELTGALLENRRDDSAPDPAISAEHRDTLRHVRKVLRAAGRDDLDRSDVDLILMNVRRSERCRRLKTPDSTLRSREKQILRRAMPRLDPELREPLKRLMAG